MTHLATADEDDPAFARTRSSSASARSRHAFRTRFATSRTARRRCGSRTLAGTRCGAGSRSTGSPRSATTRRPTGSSRCSPGRARWRSCATSAPGESTGYGRRFVAEAPTRIGTRARRLRGRLPARPHRHRGASSGGERARARDRSRWTAFAVALARAAAGGERRSRSWATVCGSRSTPPPRDDPVRVRAASDRPDPRGADGRRWMSGRCRRRRGDGMPRRRVRSDALLGRAVLDLDVASTSRETAARAYRSLTGGRLRALRAPQRLAGRPADDVTVDSRACAGRSRTISATGLHGECYCSCPWGEAIPSTRQGVSTTSRRASCARPPSGVRRRSASTPPRGPTRGRVGARHRAADGWASSRRDAAPVSLPARGARPLGVASPAGPSATRRTRLLGQLGGSLDSLARVEDARAGLLLVATVRDGLLRLPLSRGLSEPRAVLLHAPARRAVATLDPLAFVARPNHGRSRCSSAAWARRPRSRVITAREQADASAARSRAGRTAGARDRSVARARRRGRAAGTITTRDDAFALVRRRP